MSNWDDIYTCPKCKSDECVPAVGSTKSKILVVGEFPGKDEIKSGKPFSGATGAVLRTEMAKVGLDINRMRLCNLWYHVPNKNKECLDHGMQLVIKDAMNKQAILLIGSDVVKIFCDMSVSLVNGLQVTSPYLSAPIIMACVQPAVVFSNSIGELQWTLRKFAKLVEEV